MTLYMPHFDRPTSLKMVHTTSSVQCTGNASKGAFVNGVSVIILGVTVIAKRVLTFRCAEQYRPIGIDQLFFTMFNLRFFIECAATDLSNFSYSNAGFIFVNAQANVVTIGETNFEVVAASCHDVLYRFRFAIGE
jgi:hypothetical protein